MSDISPDKKKDFEKESSEDTPSADVFNDDLAVIPIEETSDSEISSQPDPFATPPSSDVSESGEVNASSFDANLGMTHVHKIDLKKPPEVPVINALSEGLQEDVANDGEGDIPSSDDVLESDGIDVHKEEVPKPSLRPLFEPKSSPPFEIYGQEPEEADQEDDDSDVSPFPPSPDSEVSPFPPSPDSEVSPFPPSPDSEVSSFPPSPDTDVSPFPPSPDSDVSPFSPSPDSDVSPFSPSPDTDVSPFPPSPDSDVSPFPPLPDSQPQPFTTSSSSDGVSKKKMVGIARSFRTLFKNLTRGGSLINRMEELREEVEVAEEGRLEEEESRKSTLAPSQFDTVPEIMELPEIEPSMPVPQREMEQPMPVPQQEMEPPMPVPQQEIESPMPVPQQEIDELGVKEPESEEGLSEPFDEFNKKEILALIKKPIGEVLDEPIEPVTPVEIPARAKDVDDLRDEIACSNELINGIANDIKDISNAVDSSNESIKEINKNADDLDSDVTIGFDSAKEKISGIENRMDVFENALTLIQSDNTELKKGLSNIEQNISELVGSYSALLSQMYETTQGSDARFEDISAKVDRINIVESKTSQIENNQVIVAKRIVEFENIASALMENITKAHEANNSLKDETKSDNAALLEEMALVTEYVEKGLKKAGAGSYRSFGEDVHLTHIEKNSSTMKLCMEWLEYLMELVGRNNLPDILSYYEELGWISDDVRLEFMQYAEGINYYVEKPDWKLNPDEHVKSIWFIEKLAGIKVDRNRLSIIEKDIERVKKGTEIYGI